MRHDILKLSAKGRTRSTRVFSNAISVCADQSGRKIYALRHGSRQHSHTCYSPRNVNAILTYWPNQKEGNAWRKSIHLSISWLHNNEITFQSDSNLFTTLNVFRRARLYTMRCVILSHRELPACLADWLTDRAGCAHAAAGANCCARLPD
jgi:hypothetical protein